ncbi:MAG TPA: CopG family transcriptional regulator [Thermoanaerobaculia bacterium]|nr:CopG family transcriptional regulator [Thermoanaerobaculia bacterium]
MACCDYSVTMIRTQIQLTEEQARRIKRLSRERSVSMAEVIRSFIEVGISTEGPQRDSAYARAKQVIGRFPDKDGARDLARAHDRHLDGAFG